VTAAILEIPSPPRPVTLRRALVLLSLSTLVGCRFETRPPSEVVRTQATVTAAVTEHYRVRNALATDSVRLRVVRSQVETRRDLSSVWVTLRAHRGAGPDSPRDSTRAEHVLLRRTDGGWTVLAATPVSVP
jgi:hypothetical protein